MATKKDLFNAVARLNNKYCKNTKNHLVVHQSYNGYSVELTGKDYMRGNKWHRVKGSMSGSVGIGNQWHDTATNTLRSLYEADSRGWIRNAVRQHEPKRNKVF